MNKQDIFNTVVAHLRKQQAKATKEELGNTVCVYRTSTGLKCAVGGLLLDEEYSPAMETGNGVNRLFMDYPRIAERLGLDNMRLLESLQFVHDHCDVYKWEGCLQSVAESHDLTLAPKETP